MTIIPIGFTLLNISVSNIHKVEAATTTISANCDTMWDNFYPDGNHIGYDMSDGYSCQHIVGSSTSNGIEYARAAVKFDYSSNVPEGVTISSAYLTLYVTSVVGSPVINILSSVDDGWADGDHSRYLSDGSIRQANQLNIFQYLYTLLLYMPDYKNEPAGINQLMPWSEFIRERCSGVMDTETETPENRGSIPI